MLNAIHGAKCRYDLEMDENGFLKVTNLKTAVTVAALRMEKTGKWGIKTAEHYRYFTNKELAACQLRKQIEAIPMTKPDTGGWAEKKCGQISAVYG